jgi:hypothetical protein
MNSVDTKCTFRTLLRYAFRTLTYRKAKLCCHGPIP